MDHKIIQNAIDIASKAHKDQFRNNGLDPYIKHCLRTSHYIEKVYSKYATTEVIASSILHDTLEDCPEKEMPIYYEQIYLKCGLITAGYVDLLTKPRDFSFYRNKRYKARLYTSPKEVIIIKLSDRIDNLSDLAQSGWDMKKLLWYIKDSVSIYELACSRGLIQEARYLLNAIMEAETYIHTLNVHV